MKGHKRLCARQPAICIFRFQFIVCTTVAFLSQFECRNLSRCNNELQTAVFANLVRRDHAWERSFLPKRIVQCNSIFNSIRFFKEPFDGRWSQMRLPSGLEKLHVYDSVLYLSKVINRCDGSKCNFPHSLFYLHLHLQPKDYAGIIKSLPCNLRILNLGTMFDMPLTIGLLPSGLEKLILSERFNQKVQVGVFPKTITHIQFGSDFNQPLAPGLFPLSLSCLRLGWNYQQPIELGVLPQQLECLELKCSYLYPNLLQDTLPPSLRRLKFFNVNNEIIAPGFFPTNLTHVNMRTGFCQPISYGFFPNSLLTIKFGMEFDSPLLPGMLPKNLTSLHLGNAFDKPLFPGTLPLNLVVLKLSGKFNHSIKEVGILPPKIQFISFGYNFTHKLRLPLPDLQHVTFRNCRTLQQGDCPPSVKIMEFHGIACKSYGSTLGLFHEGLTSLNLASCFTNKFTIGTFPQSLKSLKTLNYNHQIPCGLLPSGLTALNLGNSFNQDIIFESLPLCLLDLTFGQDFCRRIAPNCLPNSITKLQFGFGIITGIVIETLPRNLLVLQVGNDRIQLPEDCNLDTMAFAAKTLSFSLAK